MIYLDTSVVLASLLAEDAQPRAALWKEPLFSSRLLEYEVWTRIHSRGLEKSHGESVRETLGRLNFLELNPLVLGRALEAFPVPVRTLDALHLASIEFLRSRNLSIRLATYDERMKDVAKALSIPIEGL